MVAFTFHWPKKVTWPSPKLIKWERALHQWGSIARKGVRIVNKSHNVLSNQSAHYLIQILLF